MQNELFNTVSSQIHEATVESYNAMVGSLESNDLEGAEFWRHCIEKSTWSVCAVNGITEQDWINEKCSKIFNKKNKNEKSS